MNILGLIGRNGPIFDKDIRANSEKLDEQIGSSSFLVVGGAGSIGQAVTHEIFRRDPKVLHVVDISENNLVELVRTIRSTSGYIRGDFRTFSIDCAGIEFERLVSTEGPYDYILNLSALKHVRSEKDPYTIMRMIQVNICNSVKILNIARDSGAKNYFCVSTDKATNPVNMMGASKRIMEMFLMRESFAQSVSMARFANVAFSDGSLLNGFERRLAKYQPISAPNDVFRYFLTTQEAGELCLLSTLLGENKDVFFPKSEGKLEPIRFSTIASNYLRNLGYEPYKCSNEDEARDLADELIRKKKWPCYFFETDTTGEKEIEEFFTNNEIVDMNRFQNIGVIQNPSTPSYNKLDPFFSQLECIKKKKEWSKNDFLDLFFDVLPEFTHAETGKFLDQKM